MNRADPSNPFSQDASNWLVIGYECALGKRVCCSSLEIIENGASD